LVTDIYANLHHYLCSKRVDLGCWKGSCTSGFIVLGSVFSKEPLGHLAAARILHTCKENGPFWLVFQRVS
jgi:hypothetical protein